MTTKKPKLPMNKLKLAASLYLEANPNKIGKQYLADFSLSLEEFFEWLEHGHD